MSDDNKKQLEGELSERQCPECLQITYYGYWERVKDGKNWGIQCPVCKTICGSPSLPG